MRGYLVSFFSLVAFGACHLLGADALSEAKQLRDEALQVLRARQEGGDVSDQDYALTVLKLERALALCEKANATDTTLAQEISAARFWAGRFATTQVSSEVDRQRKKGAVQIPSVPSTKVAEKPKPKLKPKADPVPASLGLSDADLAAARARFEKGQIFAAEHRTQPFLVALRWFQIADHTAGTDYSVKALRLAQAAHRESLKDAGTAGIAPADTSTEDGRLMDEGDKLAVAGDWKAAMEKYSAALRYKDSFAGRKRLGHAYFSHAQQERERLLPELEEAENNLRMAITGASREWRSSYSRVKVNWRDPDVVAAGKRYREVKKEASRAYTWYDQAFAQFAKAINLAPGRKDFDAAAHQALCYSVRNSGMYKGKARMLLGVALQMHDPSRSNELPLYGYCKSELDRMNKR